MLSSSWEDLSFWESGEFQVIEERLNDLDKAKKIYNPSREEMFDALYETPYETVKVMFCGQDPYPEHSLATGLAFSIPKGTKTLPPTLSRIFDEYESDLHYPRPLSGSLSDWAKEGVLLWNVIPSCLAGHSLSHDWPEWRSITDGIIEKLSKKGIVFVFLGSRAREHAKLVHDLNNCKVIETSHPSPRGNINSKTPFIGSRIFTKTNDALVSIGLEPVNWRLL